MESFDTHWIDNWWWNSFLTTCLYSVIWNDVLKKWRFQMRKTNIERIQKFSDILIRLGEYLEHIRKNLSPWKNPKFLSKTDEFNLWMTSIMKKRFFGKNVIKILKPYIDLSWGIYKKLVDNYNASINFWMWNFNLEFVILQSLFTGICEFIKEEATIVETCIKMKQHLYNLLLTIEMNECVKWIWMK